MVRGKLLSFSVDGS
jgi:hypothetical protein